MWRAPRCSFRGVSHLCSEEDKPSHWDLAVLYVIKPLRLAGPRQFIWLGTCQQLAKEDLGPLPWRSSRHLILSQRPPGRFCFVSISTLNSVWPSVYLSVCLPICLSVRGMFGKLKLSNWGQDIFLCHLWVLQSIIYIATRIFRSHLDIFKHGFATVYT